MTTTYEPKREITWDADVRDYALFLNDQLVGYARSYADGERVLDEIVYDQLADTAAQREAQILSYSEAYRLAKSEGRELDAALYKRLGEELIAEKYGMTVEELHASQERAGQRQAA